MIIRHSGIAALFLTFFLNSDAHAFRSYRGDGEWTMNEESPTLFNPRTHGAFGARQIGRPGTVKLVRGNRTVKWQALIASTGPISMFGEPVFMLPSGLSFKEIDQAIRSFIDENYDAFRVKSADLKTDSRVTKYSGPFKYVTYQRFFRVENAPFQVQSAFLTFRFKNDRLIQITNNSFGDIGIVEAPVVGGDEAIESVMEDAQYDDAKDKISKVSAQLQPFLGSDRKIHFRFVYEMTVRKASPRGDFDYSVSALDGRIVRIMSGLHTNQVLGEAYPRLPGDSLKLIPMPEVAILATGETGFANSNGEFDASESATAQLTGQRVWVRPNHREKVSASQRGDGNIVFSASEHLSENMAYIHVARVNAFVRNFIKTPALNPQEPEKNFLDQPIMVSTHTQHPFVKNCNAFFDQSSRSLNFISEDKKCHDSSQFADIVYHEWGHALDYALGNGIQDDAFSEGIGDIVAFLMTGDSKVGPGFVKERPGQPIRDISTFRRFPEGQNPDPHVESLIVSGAWFDFYRLMAERYSPQEARMKVAEVFFKHLVSTHHYTDSYQGLLTVDDDDGNLGNCTPHMCLANAAFAKHGLAATDARCGGDEVEGQTACAPSTISLN